MLWGQKDQKDMKALDDTLQIKEKQLKKKGWHKDRQRKVGEPNRYRGKEKLEKLSMTDEMWNNRW